MKWKPDWGSIKRHHVDWWNRKGMVAHITAPRRTPAEPLPAPAATDDPKTWWTDPKIQVDRQEHQMARRLCAGDAFPYLMAMIGPGSLGTFLGARPAFSFETVWYAPCIGDPDTCGPIRFSPENNPWLDVHMAIYDEAARRPPGRYLLGMPDLIENLDTLAALRGSQEVLLDLVERPDWVRRSIAEINAAFFAAFDFIRGRIKDADGGNAFIFDVWGPGKTAKVQCDISCMISPEMFGRFVLPALSAQCDWLDYSIYHLDGEDALVHLDALLSVESLDAIEWTPRGAYGTLPGSPPGGDPRWHDLYRRIRAGGKSVQAVKVRPEQAVPLIEAVGPEGLFLQVDAPDEATAERLVRRLEQYR